MHSRIIVNCPRMHTTFPDFALPVIFDVHPCRPRQSETERRVADGIKPPYVHSRAHV